MKKWILKAIVQKLFGAIPGGFQLNYFFQKYISKAVNLNDAFFETLLGHFKELNEYANKNSFSIQAKEVFEIGTGWHPIMPFCFYLSGAKQVVTTDLNDHLRKKNLIILLEKFLDYHKRGLLHAFISDLDESRLAVFQATLQKAEELSVTEILESLSIEQKIIDAAHSGYPSAHFDLCYSVNVYEHIKSNLLEGITRELYRISKAGGLAYHSIGVYDHFVHIDKSISKFNYLRFSQKQWQIIDNNIQPQNRLRISYFKALFLKTGFEIRDEIFKKAEPSEIESIPIHSDFKGVEDVDIPYGTFILQKPLSAS